MAESATNPPNPNYDFTSPSLINAMAAQHVQSLLGDLASAIADFGGHEIALLEPATVAATTAGIEQQLLPILRDVAQGNDHPEPYCVPERLSEAMSEILASPGEDHIPDIDALIQDTYEQIDKPKRTTEGAAYVVSRAKQRLETAATIATELGVPIEAIFERQKLFSQLTRAIYPTPVEFANGKQYMIAELGPADVEEVFYAITKERLTFALYEQHAQLGTVPDEEAQHKVLLTAAEEWISPRMQADIPRIVMLAKAFATRALVTQIERHWGNDALAGMPADWQYALLPRLDPGQYLGLDEDRAQDDMRATLIAQQLALGTMARMF